MDIVADSLTKIRNAVMRKHKTVAVKKTRFIENILHIMEKEGYILGYKDAKDSPYFFEVTLKYTESGTSAIKGMKRISKLSRRLYVNKERIPRVFNNYGTAIISTSKGVITDKEARDLGVGGEVVCYIW